MTQREDLALVVDRLSLDSLLTALVNAVDDGNWAAYEALFAPGARTDLRSAGGAEGTPAASARWLERALAPWPVRQHLLVNRQFRFGAEVRQERDEARLEADYAGPLGPAGPVWGGRCLVLAARTPTGWLLRELTVREKWRGAPAPEPA